VQIASPEHLPRTLRELFHNGGALALEAWHMAARHSVVLELRGFGADINATRTRSLLLPLNWLGATNKSKAKFIGSNS
jgi:hypothetical protein